MNNEMTENTRNEQPIWKKLFTPWKELSLLRKILACVFGFFSLWSILPIFRGIIGVGLYAPLFIGLFLLFTVFAWNFIVSVKNKAWQILWAVIAVIVFIGASLFAFVSGEMLSAATNKAPSDNKQVTVVVLGCLIRGDRPSKMLANRLDTAADYLLTHPEINCIVSGGQGSNEKHTEASVMRDYLIEKGVSPARIKTEEESTSTSENIAFSARTAKKNNYYGTFYIVTDRFHQLRAHMICEKQGITSYALPCETPWYLAMYYWFREMFGLARLVLLGY